MNIWESIRKFWPRKKSNSNEYMKILAITNLFPNSSEPTRGMFNFQQLKELAKFPEVEIKIIAPIPWFPRLNIIRRWAKLVEIPEKETIGGFEVYHPRYLVIPKIFRCLYGFFFFFGVFKVAKDINKIFKFDCILATWAYPDGFGSYLISKILKKPIVIKIHGTDINSYIKYYFRRKMICYTLKHSHKVIAVSDALKKKVIEIGVPEERIIVIPNGINTDLFRPMEKENCRKELDLPIEKKIVLFVGNLKPEKGLSTLIKACNQINKVEDKKYLLVILGDGQLQKTLKNKVNQLNMMDIVRFEGRKPHDEIPIWINACDVFCLPSLNEGCPNVVLEALACAKPVVATNVGGIPEIISSESLGILVEPMNWESLAKAIIKALGKSWDYSKLKKSCWKYSWSENVVDLKVILENSLNSYTKKAGVKIKKYIKHIISFFIPKKMVMWRGRSHSNKIALTFDDGPNPEFTPDVLRILKEKNVRATFFLIGKEISKHRELAKRIIDENHSVGAHTYSHYKFGSLSYENRKNEIVNGREVISNELGKKCSIFRPPQGSMSFRQLFYCIKEGLSTILWSVNSGDYEFKGAKYILNNVIGNDLKGGDVLLFHDDNQFTLEALPKIVEYFQDRDFEFATIEEMLGSIN